MATTDTKAGFRLPWSSDKSDPAPAADASNEATVEATVDATVDASSGADPTRPVEETENPAMIDAAPAASDHSAADPGSAAEPAAFAHPSSGGTAAAAPTRRPNKFMADLTKAMQVAAEGAREESLTRLSTDAKGVIEEIHALSATEASELRRKADDDIAGIREWSKTEIARLREETDERIAHRKDKLEREIEEHAAAIEARIERVQARVTAFETEMATFFERLLAEDDPTRFAAMAESIPEPPTLDAATGAVSVEGAATHARAAEPVVVTPVVEASFTPFAPTSEPEPSAPASEDAAPDPTDTSIEASVSPDPGWGRDPAWDAPATPDISGAEAAAEPAADAGDPQDAARDVPDPFGQATSDESDPRLEMLDQSADLAAAEAEAATFVAPDESSDEPVAEIAEEAIAARLAGLVATPEGTAPETVTTRVVVTGLVSVASIAGFKRYLSRADGVQSVGVSSGPDGEFVFAVGHGTDVVLRDVIPTLPGFGATVTGEVDGEVRVAAHDPENEG